MSEDIDFIVNFSECKSIFKNKVRNAFFYCKDQMYFVDISSFNNRKEKKIDPAIAYNIANVLFSLKTNIFPEYASNCFSTSGFEFMESLPEESRFNYYDRDYKNFINSVLKTLDLNYCREALNIFLTGTTHFRNDNLLSKNKFKNMNDSIKYESFLNTLTENPNLFLKYCEKFVEYCAQLQEFKQLEQNLHVFTCKQRI